MADYEIDNSDMPGVAHKVESAFDPVKRNIIEEGYRPVGRLDTSKPPQGGSAVPSKPDIINHPPHYNNAEAHCECGRRIECIDITRHLSFNLGNAMKYIWRCYTKDKPQDNLAKAIWYLQDELKNMPAKRMIRRRQVRTDKA